MLLDQLQTNVVTSMKSGDKTRTETLRYLIAAVKKYQIDTYLPGSTGKLTDEDIVKIIRFSGRVNQEKIKKYCKFYGISEDETNITLLEKAKKADRYYAVNIQNDDTIEIRIFSGMLDYNQFMASLEFCSLILDIVTKFSVQEITQLNWEKITEFGKDYEYFYSRAVNFL